MSEKEPVKLTARLEVIEEPKAVLDPVREPEVEMTAEEIAVAEREKAQLLAELLAKAAAKRTERPPAEPVSVSEPIFIPPTPELQAMAADVNEIDAEIEALEQQNAAMVKARAQAVAADEATHKARVAALNEKRNVADAKARELRARQANAALTLLGTQVELEATAAARQAAADVEQHAALVARLQPPLDAAKRVLAELKSIWAESGPTLEKLVEMSWKDTPSTWPGSVRMEFEKVFCSRYCPNAKLIHEFSVTLRGLEGLIRDGERYLAGGREPENGVDWLLLHLGVRTDPQLPPRNDPKDSLRHLREQITMLHDQLASIVERGGANAKAIPDPIRVIPAEVHEQAVNNSGVILKNPGESQLEFELRVETARARQQQTQAQM